MNLEGKTAIVTGAGGRIGKAIATRLAREGARVAVLDLNREKTEETTKTIRNAGGEALAIVTDVTNNLEMKATAAKTLADFGQIDILVNCAGGGWQGQPPFKDMPKESWQWILDLNINGTLFPTHAVLNHMAERKYGKIINITSIAGKVGIPRMSIYSATKGAIIAFTKVLAMELGQFNINVNSISPGLITGEAKPPESKGTYLGRWGMPEEIASTVAFLASDEASFTTGADHVVDGGRILGPLNINNG